MGLGSHRIAPAASGCSDGPGSRPRPSERGHGAASAGPAAARAGLGHGAARLAAAAALPGPAGVAASFEDITDRKRIEEALRWTAERLACCEQPLQRLAASKGRHLARPDSAAE